MNAKNTNVSMFDTVTPVINDSLLVKVSLAGC